MYGAGGRERDFRTHIRNDGHKQTAADARGNVTACYDASAGRIHGLEPTFGDRRFVSSAPGVRVAHWATLSTIGPGSCIIPIARPAAFRT